ncbi:erythromycin resistance leader peptide [Staphylococcus aureus]
MKKNGKEIKVWVLFSIFVINKVRYQPNQN